jgi:hypothetical protein
MSEQAQLAHLARDMAEYWLEHELLLVATPQDVRVSLQTYNDQAPTFSNFVASSLSHTTYWVFDSKSGQFGPNKFVGYQDMNFEKYMLSQRMQGLRLDRGRFNGGRARIAIVRAVGRPYGARPELHWKLESWAANLVHSPDPFGGTSRAKWRFLRLP